jgi:hypothetical protein
VLWWVVLLRAVAGAGVVVTVSTVAELLGPFWGGLLVSLPISAGPAFVMLALEQDDAFIATGALGGLVANAATQVFILVIILLAPRWRWPWVLLVALLCWAAVAGVLRQVEWSLAWAVGLNIAVFLGFLPLTRPALRFGLANARPAGRRWFELPLRGLMVGVLVAGVVTASTWMGPTLTGMAAVFPIMLTGLALMALPRLGGPAAAALFAGTMRAMPGFAIALTVLAVTALPLGAWWGMATALVAQLGFSAVLLLLHHRRAGVASVRRPAERR